MAQFLRLDISDYARKHLDVGERPQNGERPEWNIPIDHTVVSMEWGGIKNGALLTLIESERFHVFLTGDKNMDKQQRA